MTIKNDEYEYFFDLRKIYKMSLSFLIAYAAKKLLKNLLSKLEPRLISNINKLLYHNYVFCLKVINGVKYFSHYWGIPDVQLLI